MSLLGDDPDEIYLGQEAAIVSCAGDHDRNRPDYMTSNSSAERQVHSTGDAIETWEPTAQEKTTVKMMPDGRLRKDNDIGKRGIRHCATEDQIVGSRVYVDFCAMRVY